MTLSTTPTARKMASLCKVAVSVLLTVGFGYLIFVEGPGIESARIFSQLSAESIFIGFLIYLIPAAMRAARLLYTAGLPASEFFECLKIVSIHNALNGLLPLRLGEVSIPILLNRRYGFPLAKACAILILVRLLDLIIVFLVAAITAVFVLSNWKDHQVFALMTAGAALAIIGGLLFFPLLEKRLSVKRLQFAATSQSWRRHLAEGLNQIIQVARNMSLRRFMMLFATSLACWLALISLGYWTTRSLGMELTYGVAAAAVSAAALSFLLPLTAIANFGPFELAWMFAVQTAGFSEPDALASAFMFHAATLGYAVFLLFVVGVPWSVRKIWLTAR